MANIPSGMGGLLSSAAGLLKSGTALLNHDTTKRYIGNTGKALQMAQQYQDAGGALTQLTSQTTIISRAFIEESLLGEPIIANLMRCNHEWYAAQCVAAMQLSQMVTDKKTVQETLRPIQDGHNIRHLEVLGDALTRFSGQETFVGNYVGQIGLEALGVEALGPGGMPVSGGMRDNSSSMHPGGMPKTPLQSGNTCTPGPNGKLLADNKALCDQLGAKYTNTKMQSVKVGDNRIGPMGELYELTLTNPTNKDLSIRVPLFIQMQPSIIPQVAAPRFIDMNVAAPIWQRFTQMRAGELHWFKDFILQRDIQARKRSVLKDPEAGKAMIEFLRTIARKDVYAGVGVANPSKASANLANSVVVFSEETVAQAKNESGIDLHNEATRKNYFRDTYTMIVCVVDTLHQRVTIYFNGLDGALECSYSDFKPNDKKFDPQDFVAALGAFGSNNINRMR